jgi:hypothetical protein
MFFQNRSCPQSHRDLQTCSKTEPFLIFFCIWHLYLHFFHFLELDIGENWPESEDESEMGCYGTEDLPSDIVNKAERKRSEVVRIVPDQRKSSTGSTVSDQSNH